MRLKTGDRVMVEAEVVNPIGEVEFDSDGLYQLRQTGNNRYELTTCVGSMYEDTNENNEMTPEDVWKLAERVIVNGFTIRQLREIFGNAELGVEDMFRMSPQYVKQVMDEYEQKHEVAIGDEVIVKNSNVKGFVVGYMYRKKSGRKEQRVYQVSVPSSRSGERVVYTFTREEILKTGGSASFAMED